MLQIRNVVHERPYYSCAREEALHSVSYFADVVDGYLSYCACRFATLPPWTIEPIAPQRATRFPGA